MSVDKKEKDASCQLRQLLVACASPEDRGRECKVYT